MIKRRSKSPSKPAAEGYAGSHYSRNPSPSRPASRGASAVQFDDAVFVDGEGTMLASQHETSKEIVTRAEFWDVILEDGDEAAAILPWLGNLITDQSDTSEDSRGSGTQQFRSTSSGSIHPVAGTSAKSNGQHGNPARFQSTLAELVETEASYVRRLDTLYNRYAKPLRQYARERETAIMPLYEAQRLFGNIGEILGANMAFLRDLKQAGSESLKTQIGSIAHRNMACFSCYNEYFANFEKAKHIEQTMSRNNRAFRDFAERVKHASSSSLGNVSIRELIMEPVQRIPRYKLLLDGLIKSLPSELESCRGELEAAAVLCSRIANCEVDEKTQRAAVLWSFGRSVQGFPAGMFSVHRKLIDAIDVEDFPLDNNPLLSPASSANRAIPCTLFLFDDALVVAKRNTPGISGRRALGLDNLNQLADEMKTFTERSGASQPARKGDLSFRGVSDLLDVKASDLGAADLKLFLRSAPAHIHHEKWTARPVRQYTTLADQQSDSPPRYEKMRFLENLWRAQALFKTREGRSHLRTSVIPAITPLGSESPAPEPEPRRIIHWNVFQRDPWLGLPDAHRSSTLLHVDPARHGAMIPWGADNEAPFAEMRIHAIDEAYSECSYSKRIKGVQTASEDDDDEAYVMPLDQLPRRLRRLNESGVGDDPQAEALANFRPQAPWTPSASHRGRAALENFGRSILNNTPESIRFGSPRRNRSILSRSSVATSLASDIFSSSGRSASTAGTSINSRDMLSTSMPVDANGKLLPPTSPTAASRHHRAMSADITMDGSRDNTFADTTIQSPATQRVSIPARGSSEMGAGRSRAHSVDVPTSPRQETNARPNGPRAAPTGSPRRKAVPTLDPTPYTPTRKVSASSFKRPAPSDDEGGSNGGREGRSENKRPARAVHSDGDKGRGPAVPSKDRVASKPLQESAMNHDPSSSTAPSTSANSLFAKRPTSAALRGRVHRNLARLDDVDKENSVYLSALSDEAAELSGAASQFESRVLATAVNRVEDWIEGAKERGVASRSMIAKVAGDVEYLLRRLDEDESMLLQAGGTAGQPREAKDAVSNAAAVEAANAEVEVKTREAGVLRTRCEALQRKCELLGALEKDGRLENGALHKAFNEELDRMYDDAQLTSSSEEVKALREEVKRTKSQRNDLQRKTWELERDLKEQKSQSEVYERILKSHGLL